MKGNLKFGAPGGKVPVACLLQQIVCHLCMPVQRSIVQAPATTTQQPTHTPSVNPNGM
jgi:hypothetical protein